MTKIIPCGFVPLFLLGTFFASDASAAKPGPALVERGRYIVHEAALCVDCHSPRDEKGQFIVDRHLTGSALPFVPTVPMPWAPAAPGIAGLENYTAEQAVKFFMTGERPSGAPVLPPMPAFRLSREDAEAVTAYLKSLPARP